MKYMRHKNTYFFVQKISLKHNRPVRLKKKTKHYETKKKDYKNSIEFVLCWSRPCWAWDLLLNMVCISSEIPLEKTKIALGVAVSWRWPVG